jgi:hypothetical protein
MTDFKTIASSLEERGFCVIPEFLSHEEINFLVAEFDASPDYSPPSKTKHAAKHLGDKPVAGQTGALRANAMGRKETFQRIRPRMEAFAQGITGARAALYQILYLQTIGPLSSGSRTILPDGVQSDSSQLLDSAGQTLAQRGGTAPSSLGSACRKIAATLQPLPALGRE